MPDTAPAARGVYKPRRPQARPLIRLVSDYRHRLQTVYDERFAREYGPCAAVASVRPITRRHRPPHGDGRSYGAHGARARPRARRRPSLGAGGVGDRAVCSTNSRLTPTEIPILRPPRRSDSAQSSSRGAVCSSGVSRRLRRPRFRRGRHRRLWRVWWPREGRLRPRRFLPERHRESSGLADGRPSAVFRRRSRRREYY